MWIKNRDAADSHVLADTARGEDSYLSSNATSAVDTSANVVRAFNSDGFTVGNSAIVNTSAEDYVSWTFRKQPGFFDVQTYTGTGSTQIVSHDLGCKPGLVIVKRLNSSSAWGVYGRNGASDSEIGIGYLNQNSAFTTSGVTFSCTSSAVTIYSSSFSFDATASGGTFVCLFFLLWAAQIMMPKYLAKILTSQLLLVGLIAAMEVLLAQL